MEVIEKLFVSDKDFFNMLEHSLIYDIEKATGKNVDISDIVKGFSYKKNMKNKFGQNSEVKVTICELIPYKQYKASFKNSTGITNIDYRIESIDEKSINVCYCEEFISPSKTKTVNQKIMEILIFNRKAKKHAVKLLRGIESYIQNNKISFDKKNIIT